METTEKTEEMEKIQEQNLTPTYPEQKITNYPLYVLHVIGKLLALLIFGIGTILLTIICFPILKLIYRQKKDFRYHTRYLVYVLFNGFLGIIYALGVIKIKVDKKNYLKNLKSAIIVANHPAYLDSPVMISRFPHTSIIAKAALSKKNIMHAVINELYMPNSLPYEELLERAKEDLANGNTIVMFPEGTRSTIYGQNRYKKGAARLSLATGCPIIPVYIGGNCKRGLRKGDKVLQFATKGRYMYDLYVKEPVLPDAFKDLPEAIAAKRMTQKIREVLSDEANAQYRY